MTTKAKFITIEGIEGVGKSTCVHAVKQQLEQQQVKFIHTREPGGTPIAEAIRNVMLAHYEEPMSDDAELLLAFASRAQHVESLIKPNLADDVWVLSERFTDATYAYQGGGRGIALDRISQLENWLLQDFRPDITLLLHAPVKVALSRIKGRSELDRIELEKEHFFERVQDTYFQLAKEHPERYRLIDASRSPKEVKAAIAKTIQELFCE